MDKERMAELEKIEAYGAENGWLHRWQRKAGSSLHIFALCLSVTIFPPQRQHGWNMIL